mgnify:CR=1 FL=1
MPLCLPCGRTRNAPAPLRAKTGASKTQCTSRVTASGRSDTETVMRKLLHNVALVWKELRKRHTHAREISPETIRRLADDLSHLAELAERNVPLSRNEACHLHTLREEMRSLADMTERPEFCRLSADRRLALNESLQRSQEKLLASIQAAYSSTEKVQ